MNDRSRQIGIPLFICKEGFMLNLSLNAKRIDEYRGVMRYCIHERHRSQSYVLFNNSIYNIQRETWDMAKKITESKGNKRESVAFKGFCNYELKQEEKVKGREWLRNIEEVTVELDEMFASLYKVTVVRNDGLGTYQATAFCNDAKSVNAGYILSAFAPHWYDAMGMLAYKHAVVLECVWPVDNRDDGDGWG